MLFGSSSITQLLALVVVVPLLTRIFPDKGVHGDMTVFMSIMAIGASFFTLKYDQAVMIEDDRETAKSLVKLASIIAFVFFVLSYVFLAIFSTNIASYMGLLETPSWLYLVPLTIFLTAMVDILLVWWNREKKYKKLSFNRIATFIGSAGFKIVHGGLKFNGPNGLILGHTFGQLISVVLFLPKTIVKNLSVNKEILVYLWRR
ncbi:MAG: hypothetical protein ACI9UJ_000566, partial [bacterium]